MVSVILALYLVSIESMPKFAECSTRVRKQQAVDQTTVRHVMGESYIHNWAEELLVCIIILYNII